MMDGPAFDAATCARTFSIAGSDYLADHMLPPLVDAIAMNAPRAGVSFHLWEAGYYRLLSDEGVDLVATIADIVPDNLHGRAMGEEYAGVAGPAGVGAADYRGHADVDTAGA